MALDPCAIQGGPGSVIKTRHTPLVIASRCRSLAIQSAAGHDISRHQALKGAAECNFRHALYMSLHTHGPLLVYKDRLGPTQIKRRIQSHGRLYVIDLWPVPEPTQKKRKKESEKSG